MLTVKQLIMIATRNATPPFRVGDLLGKFGGRPLSLRSAIASLQGQQFIILAKIVDLSILSNVNTFDQLQAAIRSAPGASKATLVTLDQLITPAGGSIKFLSADRKTVGIAGNANSLVAVPTVRVQSQTFDGISHVAGGLIAGGGVVIAILGLPAEAPFILVAGAGAAGAAGAGALTGLGIAELVTADSATATVSPSNPTETIVGPIPSGTSPADVTENPTIDIGDLPDTPPVDDPNGQPPPPPPPE
jgi:hypothetical protein